MCLEVRVSSPSTFNVVLGIKPIIRLGQQALVLLNHLADPEVLFHISLEYLPKRAREIKQASPIKGRTKNSQPRSWLVGMGGRQQSGRQESEHRLKAPG